MMQLFKKLSFGFVFVLATTVIAQAQWLNYRTPGVPRTADGKPKLDAPVPRASDGHPDLSGVWLHELQSVAELRRLYGPMIDALVKVDAPGMEIGTQHKYALNILLDFKPTESPLRSEAARPAPGPPQAEGCSTLGIPGFPLVGLLSEPIKIVQAPRLTMVLYETDGNHRQIYTDGRTLPTEFNLPAYYGYSVGHWEGDTFLVETAGFNAKTSLDLLGHPHSEQLRIVERFHRRDFGHLDVEMTFDDSKFYTRPFTIRVPHTLLADQDIFEMFSENEKDCAHLGRTASK